VSGVMLDHPYAVILPASFLLGCAAGFVMHRSDFCIAGMFRDLFLFRNRFMLRMLVLAVVASMVLFETARLLGLLSPYPFPLLGPPSLANLGGGLLFGAGMVLAGGCVVGTLYKMGSGSLVGALAFAGLIAGSTLYAEIHPGWSAVVTATTVFRGKVTIPEIVGLSPTLLVAPIALGASLLLLRWYRQDRWQRRSAAEGYLQPWKAALALALIGTLSYLLIGMPLGITTSYAKIGAYIESAVAPEHVGDLAYFQAEPLTYRPPLGELTVRGGAGPVLDGIAAIQFPLILGIVLGGACSAVMLREFRIYWRVPVRQCLSAVIGGVIMGAAARMAPACNVWHLLGGIPILAAQSILFVVGMVPGAWLGSWLLTRLVLRP
jgi:uncharacterized membrane protein YedE/YeeE